MNRWLFALSLAAVGLTSHGQAQDRDDRKEADAQAELVPAQVTPEMWIYSQEMKRYEDPQLALRRKAELKAAQRASRLAAMKWFGFSNARPQANPVPFMSVYSPTWTGNGYDRYDWVGARWPTGTVVLQNYEINR